MAGIEILSLPLPQLYIPATSGSVDSGRGLPNLAQALGLATSRRVNVVALGDSITYGSNATDPNVSGWATLLTSYLQGLYGNAGPGFQSTHLALWPGSSATCPWNFSNLAPVAPAGTLYGNSSGGNTGKVTDVGGAVNFDGRWVFTAPGLGSTIADLQNPGQTVSNPLWRSASFFGTNAALALAKGGAAPAFCKVALPPGYVSGAVSFDVIYAGYNGSLTYQGDILVTWGGSTQATVGVWQEGSSTIQSQGNISFVCYDAPSNLIANGDMETAGATTTLFREPFYQGSNINGNPPFSYYPQWDVISFTNIPGGVYTGFLPSVSNTGKLPSVVPAGGGNPTRGYLQSSATFYTAGTWNVRFLNNSAGANGNINGATFALSGGNTFDLHLAMDSGLSNYYFVRINTTQNANTALGAPSLAGQRMQLFRVTSGGTPVALGSAVDISALSTTGTAWAQVILSIAGGQPTITCGIYGDTAGVITLGTQYGTTLSVTDASGQFVGPFALGVAHCTSLGAPGSATALTLSLGGSKADGSTFQFTGPCPTGWAALDSSSTTNVPLFFGYLTDTNVNYGGNGVVRIHKADPDSVTHRNGSGRWQSAPLVINNAVATTYSVTGMTKPGVAQAIAQAWVQIAWFSDSGGTTQVGNNGQNLLLGGQTDYGMSYAQQSVPSSAASIRALLVMPTTVTAGGDVSGKVFYLAKSAGPAPASQYHKTASFSYTPTAGQKAQGYFYATVQPVSTLGSVALAGIIPYYAATGVQVHRLGHSGIAASQYDSPSAVASTAGFSPDAVLVELGVNDLSQFSVATLASNVTAGANKVIPITGGSIPENYGFSIGGQLVMEPETAQAETCVITAIDDVGITVTVASLARAHTAPCSIATTGAYQQAQFAPNLARIGASVPASADCALIAVGQPPGKGDAANGINNAHNWPLLVAAMREMAANNGWTMFSLWDQWQQSYFYALSQGWQDTSVHPTTAGHTAIATWAEGLLPQALVGRTPLYSGSPVPGATVIDAVTSRSQSYLLAATDSVVIVTAASLTITLPSAVIAGAGRIYTIKNGATATSTTLASLQGLIDGGTTYTSGLTAAFNSVQVVSDGTNWFTI